MRKISLILAAVLCTCTLKCQTIYGITGQIKIPNAYTVKTGQLTGGIATFEDYFDKSSIDLYQQYAGFVNIGFHSRLELGLRMSKLPDKYIAEEEDVADGSGEKTIADRVLSAKLVVVKENKNLPQLSFGMQDIIGTRIHNSTYVVVTKTIQLNKSFNTILNMGYGCKANSLLFGEASNYHFLGVFGGIEVGYKKILFMSTEYDGRDVNSGLRLMMADKLNFNISLFKMKFLMSTVSFNFKL